MKKCVIICFTLIKEYEEILKKGNFFFFFFLNTKSVLGCSNNVVQKEEAWYENRNLRLRQNGQHWSGAVMLFLACLFCEKSSGSSG